MTIFLRILTAAVLFGVLVILFLMSALIIGGGLSGLLYGVELKAHGFEAGYEAGELAGAKFGEIYITPILVLSAIASLVISCAFSFSRVFPWCRFKPSSR